MSAISCSCSEVAHLAEIFGDAFLATTFDPAPPAERRATLESLLVEPAPAAERRAAWEPLPRRLRHIGQLFVVSRLLLVVGGRAPCGTLP